MRPLRNICVRLLALAVMAVAPFASAPRAIPAADAPHRAGVCLNSPGHAALPLAERPRVYSHGDQCRPGDGPKFLIAADPTVREAEPGVLARTSLQDVVGLTGPAPRLPWVLLI